jgi:hypothetical protein
VKHWIKSNKKISGKHNPQPRSSRRETTEDWIKVEAILHLVSNKEKIIKND